MVSGVLTTGVPAPAAASVPVSPSGWNLVWSDDFDGPAGSRPDSANWLYDIGHCYPGCPANNWGTGEIENMTDSTANVSLDGSGNLAITPIRDAAGNWTSGRVETRRTDFAPPPGGRMRIEGRLQVPNITGAAAQGYWPAFWTLGAPFRGVYTNWPSIGEIDVMESVNGVNTVYGTLHCGTNPGGPCNETVGLGGSRACPGATCQAAFHTYAVELDRSGSPEQLRWYVDGIQFHTVRSDQVDGTTWRNAIDHGFFVILNVAIGGGWPGAPTAATASGVPMLVDYVSVHTAPGRSGPAPSTVVVSPAPTTATGPTGGVPTGSVPTVGVPTAGVPTAGVPTAGVPTAGVPGAPVTGGTLYLRSGNLLSGVPGTVASEVSLPSAGGVTSDGTPRHPVTFQACGIWGIPTGAATAFTLHVDAGTAIGNGVQARVSYDPTGSGVYTRVETYRYFATDPVPGYETYTAGHGLQSASGTPTALSGGCVRLELWNAIGGAPTAVRVDGPSAVVPPLIVSALG
jgi:beta-glucanase (GH16 family)